MCGMFKYVLILCTEVKMYYRKQNNSSIYLASSSPIILTLTKLKWENNVC